MKETWRYGLFIFGVNIDLETVKDIAVEAASLVFKLPPSRLDDQREGFVAISPNHWGVSLPATETLRSTLDQLLGREIMAGNISGPLLVRRVDSETGLILTSYSVHLPGPVYGDFGLVVADQLSHWGDSVQTALDTFNGV